MQPYPWLPSGNLGTGLGSQTEDALHAGAQSWRSFLSAMKGQTVLELNMSGWRGVHAQRPRWSNRPSVIVRGLPSAEERGK